MPKKAAVLISVLIMLVLLLWIASNVTVMVNEPAALAQSCGGGTCEPLPTQSHGCDKSQGNPHCQTNEPPIQPTDEPTEEPTSKPPTPKVYPTKVPPEPTSPPQPTSPPPLPTSEPPQPTSQPATLPPPLPEPTDDEQPTAEPTDKPTPKPGETPEPEPTDKPTPKPGETPEPEPTDKPGESSTSVAPTATISSLPTQPPPVIVLPPMSDICPAVSCPESIQQECCDLDPSEVELNQTKSRVLMKLLDWLDGFNGSGSWEFHIGP